MHDQLWFKITAKKQNVQYEFCTPALSLQIKEDCVAR
jgi:hypothetical protein